jgi:protein YIPF6
MLSTTLSFSAPSSSTSVVFAAVFVIVWCGAAMVTVNAQLLGGTISFFQSVCILGYCVFPLTLSSLANVFIGLIYKQVSS